MSYILVFLTIVGVGMNPSRTEAPRDWRPIGEFKSLSGCLHAADVLKIGSRAICIPTDSAKSEITKKVP